MGQRHILPRWVGGLVRADLDDEVPSRHPVYVGTASDIHNARKSIQSKYPAVENAASAYHQPQIYPIGVGLKHYRIPFHRLKNGGVVVAVSLIEWSHTQSIETGGIHYRQGPGVYQGRAEGEVGSPIDAQIRADSPIDVPVRQEKVV